MDDDSTVRLEFVDPSAEPAPVDAAEASVGESADHFLRRAAKASPDALAFADPPNRAAFDLGLPQRFSFGDADAHVDRVAARLIEQGLTPGETVALQLPNVCETALLINALWRAGLVAAPMPMMWRADELRSALTQLKPAALIMLGAFAGEDNAPTIRQLVERHDDVRLYFTFGDSPIEGVTPIDGWFADDYGDGSPNGDLSQGAVASDPAIVTWASGASGPYAVPRTHAELRAVADLTVDRLALTDADRVLCTYPFTSISSLGGQFVAALAAQAALILHQPFEYDVFVSQLHDERATYTAVPGAVIAALHERGDLTDKPNALKRIGQVWPWPHNSGAATERDDLPVRIVDVHNLAEIALIIEPRTADRGAGLPLGKLTIQTAGNREDVVLETRVRGNVADAAGQRYLSGELLIRGTAAPSAAIAKNTADPQTLQKPDANGFVSTDIRCTVDETVAGRFRCERDVRLIYHGGVAIGADELDRHYAAFPEFLDAAAFAIDDPVMGERILAAVVPRPDRNPSLETLRNFLSEKGLAAYKAPDQLVVVNAIPRDSDGGVLRDRILEQV